jgi:hypothetical protein
MVFSELTNAQQHCVRIPCKEFNQTCITNKQTNSMEQSLSWEIPWILLNPKVHYRIQNRPPSVPTLGQSTESMPPQPISWISILILSSMRRSSNWFLSLKSPHQNSMCTSSVPHTCYMPRPFIFREFSNRIMCGKEYKSYGYSLCSCFHCPVISFHLGQHICLSTLFSNTLSFCVPPSMWETKLHTDTKLEAKLQFCVSWPVYFGVGN